MATMGNGVDDLLKLLECPICMQTLEEPESLPCLHTFCSQCIRKHITTRTDKDKASADCPICRLTIPSTSDLNTVLKKDFFKAEMLEMLNKTLTAPASVSTTNSAVGSELPLPAAAAASKRPLPPLPVEETETTSPSINGSRFRPISNQFRPPPPPPLSDRRQASESPSAPSSRQETPVLPPRMWNRSSPASGTAGIASSETSSARSSTAPLSSTGALVPEDEQRSQASRPVAWLPHSTMDDLRTAISNRRSNVAPPLPPPVHRAAHPGIPAASTVTVRPSNPPPSPSAERWHSLPRQLPNPRYELVSDATTGPQSARPRLPLPPKPSSRGISSGVSVTGQSTSSLERPSTSTSAIMYPDQTTLSSSDINIHTNGDSTSLPVNNVTTGTLPRTQLTRVPEVRERVLTFPRQQSSGGEPSTATRPPPPAVPAKSFAKGKPASLFADVHNHTSPSPMTYDKEFEQVHTFATVEDLVPPTSFTNCPKAYPSLLEGCRRRVSRSESVALPPASSQDPTSEDLYVYVL